MDSDWINKPLPYTIWLQFLLCVYLRSDYDFLRSDYDFLLCVYLRSDYDFYSVFIYDLITICTLFIYDLITIFTLRWHNYDLIMLVIYK
jgi:hypothetical protein